MTLTQVINGVKKGEFKFDKLKSQLRVLEGLLDGAVIVKPANDESSGTLRRLIDHDVTHEVTSFTRKPNVRITKNFQTVDTEAIKCLLNEIQEIL